MQKILVVGGAGYIGSRLVPELKKTDDVDVCDLGRFSEVNGKMNAKDLHPWILRIYDTVIRIAGVSNDPMAGLDSYINYDYNYAIPVALARKCKEAGVKKFVLASSASVYGFTEGKELTEDDFIQQHFPYAEAKYDAERRILKYADEHFKVVVLRKGTVCGSSPKARTDLVINTMYKYAKINNKITVNNPDLCRPILDIRDAISAYIKAINYSGSGVFNISSGNYTLLELGKIVQAKTGCEMEILNLKDFRNYKINCDKAKKELGREPIYKAEDIVDDLIADAPKDLDNPNYTNIYMFKQILGK